jgi:YbbR domain-containing protein
MIVKDRSSWYWLKDNLSFKVVAFVVSTVLWLTMQGRRDVVLSRDLDLQVLLGPQMVITNSIPQLVKVEVSGPRIALKRFAERKEPYTVDLGLAKRGKQVVRLSRDGLNLPLGAKVLSIQPQEFVVVVDELEKIKEGDQGDQK